MERLRERLALYKRQHKKFHMRYESYSMQNQEHVRKGTTLLHQKWLNGKNKKMSKYRTSSRDNRSIANQNADMAMCRDRKIEEECSMFPQPQIPSKWPPRKKSFESSCIKNSLQQNNLMKMGASHVELLQGLEPNTAHCKGNTIIQTDAKERGKIGITNDFNTQGSLEIQKFSAENKIKTKRKNNSPKKDLKKTQFQQMNLPSSDLCGYLESSKKLKEHSDFTACSLTSQQNRLQNSGAEFAVNSYSNKSLPVGSMTKPAPGAVACDTTFSYCPSFPLTNDIKQQGAHNSDVFYNPIYTTGDLSFQPFIDRGKEFHVSESS